MSVLSQRLPLEGQATEQVSLFSLLKSDSLRNETSDVFWLDSDCACHLVKWCTFIGCVEWEVYGGMCHYQP